MNALLAEGDNAAGFLNCNHLKLRMQFLEASLILIAQHLIAELASRADRVRYSHGICRSNVLRRAASTNPSRTGSYL